MIGAGWAGMAAAVTATGAGHRVTVFEASRQLGGRARALPVRLPDGSTTVLDNGQHIMIGAYRETLRMMGEVGIDPRHVLLRMPLCLALSGRRRPGVAAMARAIRCGRGNPASQQTGACATRYRCSSAVLGWRLSRFRCRPATRCATRAAGLTARVMAELIEPLCVSALNTPTERSSAQVFLRVIRDALFTPGWLEPAVAALRSRKPLSGSRGAMGAANGAA